MMRRHRMMMAVLLASTMIAGGAAAEEITAHPGDTIDVEYGGGYGGGADEEDDSGNESLASLGQLTGSGGDKCSSAAMDMAMGVVSGIAGVFTGGRSTVVAQLAQQVQLMWANQCSSEQNDKLADQLSEQRRMTARIGANVARGVRQIERGARQAIGSMDGDLYGEDADVVMHDRYQSGMREGWTFEDAAEHTRVMRHQTDLATREAAATAAYSNDAVNDALVVSSNAMNLSQGADGQTSAIQAQTQMIRAQITVDAAKHASETAMATASLRMEEERRASEVISTQKLARFWGKTADAGTPIKRAVFE